MNSHEKLSMSTQNIVDENIKRIGELFPNCMTQIVENGEARVAVDFDLLRQELSEFVVDGSKGRYSFTWPDKRKAILLANAPTTKTLRPAREESVNFDITKNIYIEGDNLEVLKCLREAYLGKVKMIYIDPPYNTGNDFIYEDDFKESAKSYLQQSEQMDNEGNRLVANPESNGRFHTDWLNMMYPRLKVTRDLLSQDGVIFISIDDNELANLKKICDEIFGENNSLGIITWAKKRKGSFLSKGVISLTEYLLVYCKNRPSCTGLYGGTANANESQPIIKRTNRVSILSIPANVIKTKLPDGKYEAGSYGDDVNPVKLLNEVQVENGTIVNSFRIAAPFTWSQQTFNEELSKGATFVINTKNFQIRVFRVYGDDSFKGFPSLINGVDIKGTNEDAYEELEGIFGVKKLFDYSKPANYIKNLIKAATNFDKNAIVLDFFSGSGTTAQAVMQLNAEDKGNRRFIMVQLPELCDEKSQAFKAGYKNICELGKERIRRIGEKIHKDLSSSGSSNKSDFDFGFRVFKLDESNMNPVYYSPADISQDSLFRLLDNVKEGRTQEDLLVQTMLSLGVTLDSPIVRSVVNGKELFDVANGFLIACFAEDITDEVVEIIAKRQPVYAVLRDACFASDSVADNAEQIFKTYAPNTICKVI